ncbi:hypothetical protein SAMN02910418_00166 [Bowdeniella nasicola]|uniref:Uncharacterized protein n=1 Tax=Bowdeniella nasicola TaxID=208480 RepID=A0A1H3VQU0_9ACTO|nr:hypothetical protein SAMN02910418_00166 [Bowdeniella nasicola]
MCLDIGNFVAFGALFNVTLQARTQVIIEFCIEELIEPAPHFFTAAIIITHA